jgi:hypothetical protein
VDLPAKPKCMRQAMHGGMIGYLLHPKKKNYIYLNWNLATASRSKPSSGKPCNTM